MLCANSIKSINKSSSFDLSNYCSLFNEEFERRDAMMATRLNTLESELAALRSAKDSTVIKFGQLGFRSQRDCTV